MNETSFHDLLSGDKRGGIAALLRLGLAGLSVFYNLGVRGRNLAFECGVKKIHHAAVPVVSVGNLTTGGTGKTPFTAYLANWFHSKGVRVVLISRGYRALPGQANDEKLVLDRLCPGVPHLQNPDRVEAALVACHEHSAQLLILDDGFQHRRLARDLDIVLIDALNPWGYGHLLPRGLLREPLASLKRADLVVITRVDQCSDEKKRAIVDHITAIRGDAGCVEVAYPPVCLVNKAGETCDLASLSGQPVVAFCGIGNPAGFRRTLVQAGFDVKTDSWRVFPDHHHYQPNDLAELASMAKRLGAKAMLATQKDLVKIEQTELAGCPLWAVQIGAQIIAGDDILNRPLNRLLKSVEQ